MRKRFVKVMLFGALALASTTSLISCKDYDEDIDRIENELNEVKKSIGELETAIGNCGVKSVTYDAATGTLTIVDSNDKSVSCTIAPNLPEYTIEVDGDEIILLKGGVEVSSDKLPAGAASFDPSKLTVDDEGKVWYDGKETEVSVPTSSVAVIEKDGVVVGYTFTIDGKAYDFYIADALPLTSLVFIPEAYLNGIEAMKAVNLTYDKWTRNDYPAATLKGETWNAPATPASNSNITPDMVAYYHVNPVGVTMNQIEKLVLTASDKEFIGTRAAEAFTIADIDLSKCSIEDGILRVVFNGNSEAIQAIDAKKVTVMNLQATVQVNEETSKVINSDYSAIYKTVMKDFVLANAKDDKNKSLHNQHLYGADNAGNLIGKAEEAINASPMCEVAYTSSIDLSKYVEVHYTEYGDDANNELIGHGAISVDKLEDYGLELFYSLSDYIAGDNKTNQSSFAKLEGSVLTPHIDGVTDAPIAAIGRMPLVRVELRNIDTKEVVNVGWIKVKIVKEKTEPINWTKTFDPFMQSCGLMQFPLDYMEMNVNIYQKVGLSKGDFHQIYTLKMKNTVDAALSEGSFGAVSILEDSDPDIETVCLKWRIGPAEVERAIKDNEGKLTATVTYEALNDDSRSDVTITFETQVLTPTASFDDDSKNANYWYNNWQNIRINSLVPDVTAGAKVTFTSMMDNVFVGNKPAFKLTPEEVNDDFKLENLTYKYIFSAENNDRIVKGNDGKDYILKVVDFGNGVSNELQAAIYDVETETVVGQWERISRITDAANGTIDYGKQKDAAKAILNTYSHNDPNTFYAIIDLELSNQCDVVVPMTDGTFNAAFLRPINVEAVEGKELTDAVDGGDKLNLLDLIALTDWRDEHFKKTSTEDHLFYYDFYNVSKIEIDAAGITTDMSNGTLGETLLSDVTKEIKISQVAGAADASETNTYVKKYGHIVYENNTSGVKEFTVRIPVTVTYEYGTVKTTVDVLVNSTKGNEDHTR